MTISYDELTAVPGLRASAEEVARGFVRRRAQAAQPEAVGLNPNEELELARRLVDLLIDVLEGTRTSEGAIDAASDHGARFAALGLSAADLIDWIRGLEAAVTDRFLGTSDLGQDALRRGVTGISRWFNALCGHQLDVYESARDELSGWYSRVGTDLISYLVSGTSVDASAVNSQARALGVDPRRRFRAVAVRFEAGMTPAQQRQIRRRLFTVLRRFEPHQSILVHEQGGLLLSLVPIPGEDAELVTELSKLLEDDELRRTLYFSTGEGVSELASAGRSCRQALSALEIGIYREQRGRVTQCSEVILEVLLAHNQWVSEKIVGTRLSSIVDKPHLVETLRAYIECDMSLQRAAEELFVHPNTVAYRLRQIGERTGRDMRRIVDLVELSVAMAALDVIRMREDRQSGQADVRAEMLST